MLKYVIRWECQECGTDGKIIGEDKYEAHRTFDPLMREHEKHGNLFERVEGYEEIEDQK